MVTGPSSRTSRAKPRRSVASGAPLEEGDPRGTATISGRGSRGGWAGESGRGAGPEDRGATTRVGTDRATAEARRGATNADGQHGDGESILASERDPDEERGQGRRPRGSFACPARGHRRSCRRIRERRITVSYHILIVLLVAVALAQIAVVATSVYLHRGLAHRGLRLHPITDVGFRAVLWLTTGQSRREWVAVHRKHHAFTDREGDPHSPRLLGLWRVQLLNAYYYQREARNPDTIKKFAPD